jgi:hypothetical protein
MPIQLHVARENKASYIKSRQGRKGADGTWWVYLLKSYVSNVLMLLNSDDMRDTRPLPRNKRTSANNVALEGCRQETNERDRKPIVILKQKKRKERNGKKKGTSSSGRSSQQGRKPHTGLIFTGSVMRRNESF